MGKLMMKKLPNNYRYSVVTKNGIVYKDCSKSPYRDRLMIRNKIVYMMNSSFKIEVEMDDCTGEDIITSDVDGKYLRYIGSVSSTEAKELVKLNLDKEFIKINSINDCSSYSVGDYIIDSDLKVFRIYSWDCPNGGSEADWYFFIGDGVINIQDYV